MEDAEGVRLALERVKTAVQQLDDALVRNFGHSGTSTASSSTRAAPETQRNHHLPYSIAMNAQEEAPSLIAQDTIIGRVSAESPLTTWETPDTQRNRPLWYSSPINVREEAPLVITEHPERYSIIRVERAASSLTTRAVPDTQRNRPLGFSSAVNGQEAATPAIAQDPVTSSLSTQPSLTPSAVVDTQRKRKRRKRSLRYSHARNTKIAGPPAITQDQDTTAEGRPPIIETQRECDCAICLDTTGYTQMKTLPCDHVFHEICVDAWLNANRRCPVCRAVTAASLHVRPVSAYIRRLIETYRPHSRSVDNDVSGRFAI